MSTLLEESRYYINQQLVWKWMSWGVTCIQLPPVDAAEKGVSSDLITAPVLEAQPLVNLLSEQPGAEGYSVVAEKLWIGHLPRQHALLHLFTVHLACLFHRGMFIWKLYTGPLRNGGVVTSNWPSPLCFWTGSSLQWTHTTSLPGCSSRPRSRTFPLSASLETCTLHGINNGGKGMSLE